MYMDSRKGLSTKGIDTTLQACSAEPNEPSAPYNYQTTCAKADYYRDKA